MPFRTIAIAFLGLQLPTHSGAEPPLRTEPAAAHAGQVQEGLYEGSGRACGGTLRISPKRLTWRSPFSQCSAPAVVFDRRSEGDAMRWAYRLGTLQKQCLYKVVMIEKIETPGAPVAWNVSGFPSVGAYRTDASDARLDCYLVKLR